MTPASSLATIPLPPEVVVHQIGKTGINLLWTAFVIYILATLLMALMAFRHEKQHRVFHLLFIYITIVAAMSYYAMAIETGYKFVDFGTFTRDGKTIEIFRQVFWVRYVDWALTTPIIFLSLSLLAGLPWLNTIALGLANIAIMLTVMFSAIHDDRKSAATWGWFAFGCAFLIFVLEEVLVTGLKAARKRHASLYKLYAKVAVYMSVLWVVYPTHYMFSEGSALISVDCEIAIWVVLDLLTTVVLGLWIILSYNPTRDDEVAARLPDCFTDERGYGRGAIQLPGEGE